MTQKQLNWFGQNLVERQNLGCERFWW